MKALITLISLMFFSLPLSVNTISLSLEAAESSLTVSGTSTLHPWELSLERMNCDAQVFLTEDQLIIEKLSFSAESESLKSEHGRIMDRKTHKALKSEKYSTITYKINTAQSLTIIEDQFNGVLKGSLQMAGVEKPIELKVEGNVKGDIITLKGIKSLKMTDFQMDPPTALMGTIKTGDEVSIHYEIRLKSK